MLINSSDRTAHIDFTGTSPQQSTNLNAPLAICIVVLYVFRTLVDDDIPLNAGCLKPLEIMVPVGCMLNLHYPSAVGDRPGGNGVTRRIRFREAMTAAILSGHRRVPPFGLAGGEPGAIGHNWIDRSNGDQESLGSSAEVQMAAGDVFVIENPGGGGYGSSGEDIA